MSSSRSSKPRSTAWRTATVVKTLDDDASLKTVSISIGSWFSGSSDLYPNAFEKMTLPAFLFSSWTWFSCGQYLKTCRICLLPIRQRLGAPYPPRAPVLVPQNWPFFLSSSARSGYAKVVAIKISVESFVLEKTGQDSEAICTELRRRCDS